MPHATMPATGFQAFILCGPGASLEPFTSNPADAPKALINIANRPMIWYPLDWCYRMGISNIHLVTPQESRAAIEAALSQNPHLTSLPSPKASVIAPAALDLTTGTAEIFRLSEVQNAITGDFLVLPCDIVCEMNGLSLLESWMILQADLSSRSNDITQYGLSAESQSRRGGLGVWYQTKDSDEGGVGVKKEETDFLGTIDLLAPAVPPVNSSLRPRLRSVALSMPIADLKDDMEEKQSFQMRHALLRKAGNVKLQMTHRDAHIYFFPHWTKELMKRNETFESISADLIGWWAKAGWQAGVAEKLGRDDIFNRNKPELADRSTYDLESEEPIDIANLSTTSTALPNEKRKRGDMANEDSGSGFASRVHDAPLEQQSKVVIPPFIAYAHPAQPTASLLRRIDTVPLLLSASLHLAKLSSITEAHATGDRSSPFAHAHKVSPTITRPPQITIHEPTVLIDANVTLTPKSTIRESVIGSNCILGTPGATGAGVRLNRCVIMEAAVVENGNVLNGCVLGKRCRIKAGCDLRDCFVQDGYVVPEGTTSKGEVFAGFDESGDDDGFEGDDDDIYGDGGGADQGGIALG